MSQKIETSTGHRPTVQGRPFTILQELRALPNAIRPLQFDSLITGAQYLPLYRLTRRYVAPGQHALDWGCGNGHFSYFLLRQKLNVRGFSLEPKDNALAPYLADRFGDAYGMTEGDPDNPVRLPFADRRFDFVFSIGVLEHVRETGGSERASLEEIARVLRPGGMFICGMLPKRYSWIEFLVGQMFKGKHHHMFRYVRREVESLVDEAGLDLVDIGTHGFLPRNSFNHRWLKPISDRQALTRGFNAVDRALAKAASPIAQNFLFSARRPA